MAFVAGGFLTVASTGVARAEEKRQPGAAEPHGPVESLAGHRMTSDLNGTYLTAGPVAGAVNVEHNWNSAVGAELSLVRLREGRLPALLGVSFGGVVFDDRPGARTWAEVELGIDRLPVKFGLSAGLAIEWDRVRPPRLGAQGTLWLFAGIVPYVRVGRLEEVGTFFEAGLMIKIPVKLRY